MRRASLSSALDELARGRDLRPREGPLGLPLPGDGHAWRHHRVPPVAHEDRQGGQALASAKAPRGLRASERPGVISTDKAATYGPAIASLKRKGKLSPDAAHHQVQSLNDRLEAHHDKLERLIKPMLGFQSLRTAFATLKGFEVMRALEKGQGALFRTVPGIAGEVSLAHRAFGLV